MITEMVVIQNHIGLHARPSCLLASEAEKFKSDIQIRYGERTADAKKIISILALGVGAGERIELQISGEDEKEAAAGIRYLLQHMDNA